MRYLSFFSKSGISLSIIRIFLIVIPIFNIDVSIISQSYMEISLYRNRIARKGKNRCCEIIFQTAFYLNIYFILRFIRILKLGTQFEMYYKLRCNSTQFVIYNKLRNYYKLQRNTASIVQLHLWGQLIDLKALSRGETSFTMRQG